MHNMIYMLYCSTDDIEFFQSGDCDKEPLVSEFDTASADSRWWGDRSAPMLFLTVGMSGQIIISQNKNLI